MVAVVFCCCCYRSCYQDDGSEEGRSRRSNRKDINYAELNDFYLPPLRSTEVVGNKESRMPTRRDKIRSRFEYIHEDYLAPRVRSSNRRRLKEASPELEVVIEQEEEEVEKEVRLKGKTGIECGQDLQYLAEDSGSQNVQEKSDNLSEEEFESDSDKEVARECYPLPDTTASHSAEKQQRPPVTGSILGKRSFDHPNLEATPAARLLQDNTSALSYAVSNGSPVAEDARVKATLEREGIQVDTWRIPVEGRRASPAAAPMPLWTEKEAFEQLPQQFLQDPEHLTASSEQSVRVHPPCVEESHRKPEVSLDENSII